MRSKAQILNDHDDQNQSLLLTVKDAADQFRCSEAHIRRLIDSGELDAIRIGNGPRSPYRVPRNSLESYVARKLEQKAYGLSRCPELKTRRRLGSSDAWALSLAVPATQLGGSRG